MFRLRKECKPEILVISISCEMNINETQTPSLLPSGDYAREHMFTAQTACMLYLM